MGKPSFGSLRTFGLVLAGFGLGNATSALELAAITNSEESIFRNYVLKGIAIVFIAWMLVLYAQKRSRDNK